MDLKEAIKCHLDKMAAQDFAFAERYKLESKNLDDCVKYITEQARKQAKHGCAAVEDSIVFGWAVHYYQEDDIKVKDVKAKVVVPKVEKPKVEKPKQVKTIKALVKDKDKTQKCIQLDLFGDF